MKIRAAILLAVAATMAAGVALRVQRETPNPSEPVDSIPAAAPGHENPAPTPAEPPVPAPLEAAATPAVPAPPEKVRPPVVVAAAAAEAPPPAPRRTSHITETFFRQAERLDHETDPARRLALIRSLAGYVRVDTPSTIDWAMALENPDERRAALEAINQNALSGIGAQIEVDETGFPRIKETTVLSAIASTGQVEKGDYIVGMLDGSGQPLYFKDIPLQQVVQVLRGQPGSEIQLIMERVPTEGGTPVSFDVSVTRSMLVVQPPY